MRRLLLITLFVLFAFGARASDIPKIDKDACGGVPNPSVCIEMNSFFVPKIEKFLTSHQVAPKILTFCVADADLLGVGYGELLSCLEKQVGIRKFYAVFPATGFNVSAACTARFGRDTADEVECYFLDIQAQDEIKPLLADASDQEIAACIARGKASFTPYRAVLQCLKDGG